MTKNPNDQNKTKPQDNLQCKKFLTFDFGFIWDLEFNEFPIV